MNLRTAILPDSTRQRCHGLTLMELMLVMALLVIVLAVAAPSLARFFRSRNLDLEAGRFLSLTRYGQSRAASEGVPMVLWIDAENRKYGLQTDATYARSDTFAANDADAQNDTKTVEYSLDEKLQIEVEQPVVEKSSGQWWQNTSTASFSPNNGLMNLARNNRVSNLPQIRFLPDGSIDETSPVRVLIREQEDNGAIWITQNRSRLEYELQTANQQTASR